MAVFQSRVLRLTSNAHSSASPPSPRSTSVLEAGFRSWPIRTHEGRAFSTDSTTTFERLRRPAPDCTEGASPFLIHQGAKGKRRPKFRVADSVRDRSRAPGAQFDFTTLR
jgi:hypothetical protein